MPYFEMYVCMSPYSSVDRELRLGKARILRTTGRHKYATGYQVFQKPKLRVAANDMENPTSRGWCPTSTREEGPMTTKAPRTTR